MFLLGGGVALNKLGKNKPFFTHTHKMLVFWPTYPNAPWKTTPSACIFRSRTVPYMRSPSPRFLSLCLLSSIAHFSFFSLWAFLFSFSALVCSLTPLFLHQFTDSIFVSLCLPFVTHFYPLFFPSIFYFSFSLIFFFVSKNFSALLTFLLTGKLYLWFRLSLILKLLYYLFVCLSDSLIVYLSVCLSVCNISLGICAVFYLSVCLSVMSITAYVLSICSSACLSCCCAVCLSVILSICICVFVCCPLVIHFKCLSRGSSL